MRVALVFFGLCAACQNGPSESHNIAASSAANTSAATFSSGVAQPTMTAPPMGMGSSGGASADVTWTKPKTWGEEPVVGMRKATYRITKVAGDTEDATVSVIQAGGSIDENIDRWKSQFDSPHDFKRSETKAGGFGVTLVEVHGLYTGGGMMVGESPNPRPSWALVGAIVATGHEPYFFKMLGPDKTVSAARSDFQALVDSVKPK